MTIKPSSVKAKIRLLSVLLIISIFFSVSCSSIKSFFGSVGREKAIAILDEMDFKQLEEAATASYLDMYYILSDPKALSIETPLPTLGEFSFEEFQADLEEAESNLRLLDSIDPSILPQEYAILYDVLKYDMEEVLDYKDFYYFGSPFNSITGIQSELPIVMVQIEFTDKESIENYILLISDVDRYFGDCLSYEKERAALGLTVADVYLDKLIESCQSMLEGQDTHFMKTTFADRLAAVEGLTDTEKQDYITRHDQALNESFFPAYEQLITGFTELKGTSTNNGGLCNLESGKEYYEVYFKTRSGTDLSPLKGAAKIDRTIKSLYEEIYALDLSSDQFWDDYYATIFSKGTMQENIDYCKAYISKDFPALPEHSLVLQQVPPQLEGFFSPAAYFSCRIDNPEKNVIITNESSLAGETNILDTMAHEGYPGHLYQNVYHAKNIKNYYQRVASFTAFSEGWAEYSGEYILTGTDYDPNMIQVQYLDSKLQKLMMARVDIGVNYEGWDKAEVEKYLSEYGMDSPEYVDWIWDIAIEIPCYVTPYCFGQIETADIIGSAVEELGTDVPMMDIHTAYLQIGPAPFVIIEKYMDEFVNNT